MIPIRLYAYAAAVVALLAALFGYGHYQKLQGRAEIQVKFDTYIAEQSVASLNASLANQETSLLRQKAVDRSRQNDYENTKKLESANDSLRSSVAGLRDTIKAIDNSTKTVDDTEAISGSDDSAKISRELLGECAIRYSSLAEEAGNLAAQVMGLQGFVIAIEESGPR